MWEGGNAKQMRNRGTEKNICELTATKKRHKKKGEVAMNLLKQIKN